MTEQTDAAEVTVSDIRRYLNTHGGAVDESDLDAITDLYNFIAAREAAAEARGAQAVLAAVEARNADWYGGPTGAAPIPAWALLDAARAAAAAAGGGA